MRIISSFVFVLLLLVTTSGCTIFRVSLGEEMLPLTEKTVSGEGVDKVLLLDISGFIGSEDSTSLLGSSKKPGLLSRVREQLDRARKDRNVKALVLRINSPGGGVTASDILYHEIKKFKEERSIPVVAHIMDTGASGAYYAALAADRITAQPTSITGSIGVIMLRFDATGLMEKIGVRAFEIASGEKKGMGSPFRRYSAEEEKLFKTMIDSLQTRFVNMVALERKIPLEKVTVLADGRVYTSADAQASGLIDAVLYLDEALEVAKKMANIKEASVVTYFRPGEYRANLYSFNLINIDAGTMMQPGTGFMYLWWP